MINTNYLDHNLFPLEIISIGEKNNIMMQVGGFIETKIVFTVNCHLAYLSKNIKFFENV